MAAIGIASMALGAASSIFGGAQAAKAQKKANQIRRKNDERENAWYNRRYNEDYADTAAGQRLITQAKDYARDNFQRAQGAQAVGGGTTAATAAAKESGSKVVAQTLSNVAAQDTARKDNVDSQHNANQNRSAEESAQTEENRGAQINAAATQAGNALVSGGAALLQDSAKSSQEPASTQSDSSAAAASQDNSNVRTQGVPNLDVEPNVGEPYGEKEQWHL